MRHFCFLGLVLTFPFHTFSTPVSPADLAALDRLECFAENPLVSPEHDLTLLAILPPDADVLRRQGPRLIHAFGPDFVGQWVESDLGRNGEPGAVSVAAARGSTAATPVFRLMLAKLTGDREVDKQTFRDGVDEVRRLIPGARIRCVYDLVRWTEARLCQDDIVH